MEMSESVVPDNYLRLLLLTDIYFLPITNKHVIYNN